MARGNAVHRSLVVFLFLAVADVLSTFQMGSLRLTGSPSLRSMQLLNQLCNESQDDDKTINRDACYGCFFRASSDKSGYPLLLSMSNCASSYLNNTDYGHCADYLENATGSIRNAPNPDVIYCSFLECIRQVNKDNLMRDCVHEAVAAMPGFTSTTLQLAQLLVNTSACVLAKTRCAEPNPITGASREAAGWLGVNALLVNSDYDINIVRLPFGAPADECHKYRKIDVASWPGVRCSP